MKLSKDFGLFTKVVVYLQPEIYRVEVYDLRFSFNNPQFVLGFIVGKKTYLSTGWTTTKDLDSQTRFAEALVEAHHIFQDSYSSEELKILGYK